MVENPLIQALRAARVNITAQRIAICNWLVKHQVHPTASELYAELEHTVPSMSLATVYNTLALLERMGLIIAVSTTSDGRKRYDVNTEQHVNLVSEPDGEVLDVYDAVLLAEVRRVADAHGFDPQRVRLVIFGPQRYGARG